MPKTKDELRQNTLNYMNELVGNRERVASFFRHESVKYAS